MSKAKKLRGASFAVDDRVLCYEPDPTKARVLYDSKVVEVDYHKEEKGRKVIQYLIHFKGWNKSWDRWVTEDMILHITKENKMIQRELNEEAKRKSRKRSSTQFDFPAAKKRCHTPGGSKSVLMFTSDESDSDDDDDDLTSSDSDDDDSDDSSTTDMSSTSFDSSDDGQHHSRQRHRAQRQRGQKQYAASSPSVFHDSDDDFMPDPRQQQRNARKRASTATANNLDTDLNKTENTSPEEFTEVPLDICPGLREILESDCMHVTQSGKLHQLPATQCISTVLDDWLDFVANQEVQNSVSSSSSSAPPRSQSTSGVTLRSVAPNKNTKSKLKASVSTAVIVEPSSQLSLCQEVVGSLMMLFDFTLASHLLYDKERGQYSRLVRRRAPALGTPLSSGIQTIRIQVDDDSHGVGQDSVNGNGRSVSIATVAEASSTVHNLSNLRACSRQQPVAEVWDAPTSGTSSVRSNVSYLSRASVTEHSYSRSPEYLVLSEAARRIQETGLTEENTPTAEGQKAWRFSNGTLASNTAETTSGEALASRANRVKQASQSSSTASEVSEPRRTRSRSLSQSVKAEPTLDPVAAESHQLPVARRSSSNTGESAQLNRTTGNNTNSINTSCPSEQALEVTNTVSKHAINFTVRPSNVYGVPHLLRLFVFLPGILARMSFSDGHLQVLYEHLYMILAFLNERRQEYTGSTQYHKPV